MLVPAAAKLQIPVSCLEAGRWGRRRDFAAGSAFTHRRVRRAKNEAVAWQAATADERRGDQHAVWGSIDAELDDLRVSAPTRAMAAADSVFEREPDRQAAADELGALGPLPGQCAASSSPTARGWSPPRSSAPPGQCASRAGSDHAVARIVEARNNLDRVFVQVRSLRRRSLAPAELPTRPPGRAATIAGLQ